MKKLAVLKGLSIAYIAAFVFTAVTYPFFFIETETEFRFWIAILFLILTELLAFVLPCVNIALKKQTTLAIIGLVANVIALSFICCLWPIGLAGLIMILILAIMNLSEKEFVKKS